MFDVFGHSSRIRPSLTVTRTASSRQTPIAKGIQNQCIVYGQITNYSQRGHHNITRKESRDQRVRLPTVGTTGANSFVVSENIVLQIISLEASKCQEKAGIQYVLTATVRWENHMPIILYSSKGFHPLSYPRGKLLKSLLLRIVRNTDC